MQTFLVDVALIDFLLLRNIEHLLEKLSPLHKKKCVVFSLSIQDIYYSLEKVFLDRLRSVLEEVLLGFQPNAGISVEYCVQLVPLYLIPQ